MDVKHSELLPCPFCGRTRADKFGLFDRAVAHNQTHKAGCVGCGVAVSRGDLQLATKAWNTRANSYYPDKALIAELSAIIKELLEDAGGSHMDDEELQHEIDEGGEYAIIVQKARAALKQADLTHRSAIDDVKGGGHE